MTNYYDILEGMKAKYAELSGFEVQQYSDLDLRFKVLAGELYKEQVNLDFIKNQMFVQTATGEYLDYHGQDRGLIRKTSTKAKGEVKFGIPVVLDEDITIPKGTVVGTSGTNTYLFATDNEEVIAKGKTSVTVPCTAVEGGADSNVVVGAINILVTTVPGIETVKNTTAFTGGVDVESDESLRSRIIETYNSISNGTNAAYYKKLALSVPGVTEASVVPRSVGEGTVDVYISSDRKEPTMELVNEVQQLLDKEREINLVIFVIPAKVIDVEIGVGIKLKEGYDYETISAKVKLAITEYVNSRGIGEDILENHLGNVVLSVEGVYDYSFSGFYTSNYKIPIDSFPVIRTLVTEEIT